MPAIRRGLPVVAAIVMLAWPILAFAQAAAPALAPNPDSLPGAESHLYKTTPQARLMLHVFRPTGAAGGPARPAIVFFFGGGWQQGTVTQFVEQSKYLAGRGMVAVIADYRVALRHGVTPVECIADAKSAIRWVRAHARELGVDPDRLVASGGSAGGHLAAAAATIRTFDDPNDDRRVSAVPNALVLFNPVLDTTRLPANASAALTAVAGSFWRQAQAASPLHHVARGAPPAIIFHGTADTTVPIDQPQRFCEAMLRFGNRCELRAFEGRGHGFFNFGRGNDSDFRATLRATDEFLASLDYLTGAPTLAP